MNDLKCLWYRGKLDMGRLVGQKMVQKSNIFNGWPLKGSWVQEWTVDSDKYCVECQKRFYSKWNLDNHVNR